MPRGHPQVVDDGIASHLVDPRAEALLVAEPGQAALHAEKHVLDHVVHVGLVHAARDERPQPGLQRPPGAPCLRLDHVATSGAQQVGAQQDLPPGLRASMLADAT